MKVVKMVQGRTVRRLYRCFRSDFEAAASSQALLAGLVGQAVAAHFLRIERGRVAGMRRFEGELCAVFGVMLGTSPLSG
jgi:hypothetical protein